MPGIATDTDDLQLDIAHARERVEFCLTKLYDTLSRLDRLDGGSRYILIVNDNEDVEIQT